jgi:hypothetical protein
MDDQTVFASNEANQSIRAIGPALMGIALLIQIEIHSIAAMYAHTATLCHVRPHDRTSYQSC